MLTSPARRGGISARALSGIAIGLPIRIAAHEGAGVAVLPQEGAPEALVVAPGA